MSKELLEAINKLDIRVYSTTSGRQLIGEVSFDIDMKITLYSPLEFVQQLSNKTLTSETVLVQPVTCNTGPISLYINAIESESIADIRLKKLYCDQLIANKIALLEDETPSKSIDYFDSVINNWKNTLGL